MNIYESSKVLKFIDPEGPITRFVKNSSCVSPKDISRNTMNFIVVLWCCLQWGPIFLGGNLLKVFDRINYQ
jgi:hypothetical protein